MNENNDGRSDIVWDFENVEECEPFLKKSQFKALYEHLAKELDPDYAEFVTGLIDIDCSNYIHELKIKGGKYDDSDYVDLIKSLDIVIDSLHSLEAFRFPLPDEKQLLRYKAAIISNEAEFNETLKPGRGAPPKTERNKLIWHIYHYYPRGTAKKTEGGHFEKTVEMVLGYLEPLPKDIHKTIRNALRGE